MTVAMTAYPISLLCSFAAAIVLSSGTPDEGGLTNINTEEAPLAGTNMSGTKPQGPVLPDGITALRGQVVGGGAPCVQFRTDAGQQISLEGASPQTFRIGDRLEITGHFVAQSRCMQGPAFNVADHTPLVAD